MANGKDKPHLSSADVSRKGVYGALQSSHRFDVESKALIRPPSIPDNIATLRTNKVESPRSPMRNATSSLLFAGGVDVEQGSLEAQLKLGQHKVKAALNKSGLHWVAHPRSCCSGRRSPVTVSYDEILSASYSRKERGFLCFHKTTHQLTIHTFRRRRRKACMWHVRHIRFSVPTEELARDWVQRINAAVHMNAQRPKALLVLLNPFGGRGKARDIWMRHVKPIFELAAIKSTAVETLHMGHAREFIKGLALQDFVGYDGIIAVGGDGLFQEVVNGLLTVRAGGGEKGAAAARMRLGHIGAGSTDTVAYSLHGTRSVETAALHVAIGDRLPVDIMRVETADGQHRFAVSIAAYGFMGDLMQRSERLRWLGPPRYAISGIITFLLQRSYGARVSYVPATTQSADQKLVCRHGCRVCEALHPESPHGHAAAFADPAANAFAELPGGDEPLWKTMEGEFKGIMCVVMPCRSDLTGAGLAPWAHLADGRIHLVLVHNCGLLAYLRVVFHLLSRGVEVGKFAQVHALDATAVRVEPLGRESVWSVDGELLADQHVTTKVHRGLIDVFARGIE